MLVMMEVDRRIEGLESERKEDKTHIQSTHGVSFVSNEDGMT